VAATVREAAAGIAGAGMGDVADLVAKGLFKREYRDHRLEWMVRTGGLEIVVDGIAKGNVRFGEEFR
jgi:glutathione S-transferase/RNA polymerase-associated protein